MEDEYTSSPFLFHKESKIDSTAILYRDIKFRPGIILLMEKNTFIGDNCTILVPGLILKEGSQINAGTVLAGRNTVTLEQNAVIGYNCVLVTSSDSPRGKFMNDASPEKDRVIKEGEIVLKKNSFVSSLCTIAPGVVIGENSFVGPNSPLIQSLPPNKLYSVMKYAVVIEDRT